MGSLTFFSLAVVFAALCTALPAARPRARLLVGFAALGALVLAVESARNGARWKLIPGCVVLLVLAGVAVARCVRPRVPAAAPSSRTWPRVLAAVAGLLGLGLSFALSLFAWSPSIGAVGGQTLAYPPEVHDPVAGSSRSLVKTIVRLPIDTRARVGTPAGSLVKQLYFADVPDFVINVCFAAGDFPLIGPGKYADPTSLWFNVFFGYYQVDAAKPAWGRPFGYDLSGRVPVVDMDEVLRLAKADWNYLSNWNYGVPLEAVVRYDGPDPDIQKRWLGRFTVGASQWDLVDLDGFSAVTAYQSDAAGAAQLVDNTFITRLWRATFGEPSSQPGHDVSFPGASMRARIYLAFFEDADAYHTVIVGGTVNKAFDGEGNDRLMEEELGACRGVIEAHFPTLGFPPSSPVP